MTFDLFISYSHQDEWLKDELVSHLSALRRSRIIDDWHDRKIVPGQKIDPEIADKIETSDIFLFLVSPDFIQSDYCMEKEYIAAKKRNDDGEAIVIPVLVRECDWDVEGLREFLTLPTDANAVTKGAVSKDDTHQRDGKWLDVINGLKSAIAEQKKNITPPELNKEYRDNLFKVNFIRHPSLSIFDEEKFWVDPEIYYEKTKEQINTTNGILQLVRDATATVFTGPDRSGKTLLAKKLQTSLNVGREIAVIISGSRIGNADIISLISKEIVRQYGVDRYSYKNVSVIIDDFDNCNLPDRIKENIIREISERFGRSVIFSFSSAPSVLYAPDDLPDPISLSISPIGDEKIFEIVTNWKLEDGSVLSAVNDTALMEAFEKIQTMFTQTETQKYAYNVITFLELLDSALGGDIAPASFASCYDTLVQNRLLGAGCDPRQIDESKNFLSLVAYKAFSETEDGFISAEGYDECLSIFCEQYLSSPQYLSGVPTELFLNKQTDGFRFLEDYIWYFLCARYVGKSLVRNDHEKYRKFIQDITANIFQKKYANIVIYLAYFTEDNLVIRELMKLLDKLFAKADDWRLSDKSRSIILGLSNSDQLSIPASADVGGNRADLLKSEVKDIINDAEEVVARYTLPFLDPKIDDSELVDEIPKDEINGDSYIKSVNALLRTHSVIGQILNSRSGTYGADLVINCIEKMVEASGRYAYLNHSIATLILYDPDLAIKTADDVLNTENMTKEEKYLKVMRIFAFWSVFLSQTGLARYLAQDHSIRALEKLVKKHEGEKVDEGHIPFNFTSVLLIARLYRSGKIDRASLEESIRKYGSDSSLFALYRTTIHIYSYYMPMTVIEKQWISSKLGIPIRTLERQGLRGGLPKLPAKPKLPRKKS